MLDKTPPTIVIDSQQCTSIAASFLKLNYEDAAIFIGIQSTRKALHLILAQT